MHPSPCSPNPYSPNPYSPNPFSPEYNLSWDETNSSFSTIKKEENDDHDSSTSFGELKPMTEQTPLPQEEGFVSEHTSPILSSDSVLDLSSIFTKCQDKQPSKVEQLQPGNVQIPFLATQTLENDGSTRPRKQRKVTLGNEGLKVEKKSLTAEPELTRKEKNRKSAQRSRDKHKMELQGLQQERKAFLEFGKTIEEYAHIYRRVNPETTLPLLVSPVIKGLDEQEAVWLYHEQIPPLILKLMNESLENQAQAKVEAQRRRELEEENAELKNRIKQLQSN